MLKKHHGKECKEELLEGTRCLAQILQGQLSLTSMRLAELFVGTLHSPTFSMFAVTSFNVGKLPVRCGPRWSPICWVRF